MEASNLSDIKFKVMITVWSSAWKSTQKQTQRGGQNGESKKQAPNERTREFSRGRTTQNEGKQFIRYKVQSNDYKYTQQHEKRHRNHKKGPVRNKECQYLKWVIH